MPLKNVKRRQSYFPLGPYIKGIALIFSWPKCLGVIQHFKSTAGCHISTLIFWFFLGDTINIPWTIVKGRQTSFPFGTYVKSITRVFYWLKWLGGIMHLKFTAGCQLWTLKFGLFWGHYKYPIKKCQRKTKFFPTLGLCQKYYPGLLLTYVPGWDYAPQVHSRVSTMNFDICNFLRGTYKYPMNNFQRTQSSFPLWAYVKGITRVFYWLKCLCGICTSRPKQGVKYQLWYLDFLRGYCKYPIKKCQRKAKFFPTLGLSQRCCLGL